MLIWLLGAAAVFFLVVIFVWALSSQLTGRGKFTTEVAIGGIVFAVAFFGWGWFRREGNNGRDWERIAQAPLEMSGMRISGRRNFEAAQGGPAITTLMPAGMGIVALVFAGPDWLKRAVTEGRTMLRASEEVASRLEALRKHIAARDAWVPLADFGRFEDDIYLLAELEMISVREMAGHWYFHVTVQGTAKARVIPPGRGDQEVEASGE